MGLKDDVMTSIWKASNPEKVTTDEKGKARAAAIAHIVPNYETYKKTFVFKSFKLIFPNLWTFLKKKAQAWYITVLIYIK